MWPRRVVSWVVRFLNIGIILTKFIILHEALFVLPVMSTVVTSVKKAKILSVNLSILLLLILLLILLVPIAEIGLILYLRREVNWREGWIEWLRLRRGERVARIWSAALLEGPRLESTLTQLVSAGVKRGLVWHNSAVKCQIEVIEEGVVLVFAVEEVRQYVRLPLIIYLSCLLL